MVIINSTPNSYIYLKETEAATLLTSTTAFAITVSLPIADVAETPVGTILFSVIKDSLPKAVVADTLPTCAAVTLQSAIITSSPKAAVLPELETP